MQINASITGFVRICERPGRRVFHFFIPRQPLAQHSSGVSRNHLHTLGIFVDIHASAEVIKTQGPLQAAAARKCTRLRWIESPGEPRSQFEQQKIAARRWKNYNDKEANEKSADEMRTSLGNRDNRKRIYVIRQPKRTRQRVEKV
jgi:hypothetical protein